MNISEGIYWDKRWDMFYGCTPVSEGCKNCWAKNEARMRQHNHLVAERFAGVVDANGEWTGIKIGELTTKWPVPDRGIIYDSYPEHRDNPIRHFMLSRGCPYNCSYCFNSTWNKMFPDLARVRTRNAKDVVKEIVTVNPEFVYFQDSCFAPNIAWMREFSKVYRSWANVPYHCHLRPNMVNEERVLLLHDSNCVSVKCALETGSDRLRKLINRGHMNNEDAYVAARWLKKWDIKLILQNILGLPTATIEDDLFTLEVNIRCRPAYAWCSIFQPYPATELANLCVEKGWYKGDFSEIGDNFFDQSVLDISEEHKEQVACLQRIFAFCTEMQVMPEVRDLTWERLPKFVHEVMRKVGDKRMFPGVM